jgi:hypothetical protein
LGLWDVSVLSFTLVRPENLYVTIGDLDDWLAGWLAGARRVGMRYRFLTGTKERGSNPAKGKSWAGGLCLFLGTGCQGMVR